jgi:hypothetical protein
MGFSEDSTKTLESTVLEQLRSLDANHDSIISPSIFLALSPFQGEEVGRRFASVSSAQQFGFDTVMENMTRARTLSRRVLQSCFGQRQRLAMMREVGLVSPTRFTRAEGP